MPFSSDTVCFVQPLHNVYTTGLVAFILNLLHTNAGFVSLLAGGDLTQLNLTFLIILKLK